MFMFVEGILVPRPMKKIIKKNKLKCILCIRPLKIINAINFVHVHEITTLSKFVTISSSSSSPRLTPTHQYTRVKSDGNGLVRYRHGPLQKTCCTRVEELGTVARHGSARLSTARHSTRLVLGMVRQLDSAHELSTDPAHTVLTVPYSASLQPASPQYQNSKCPQIPSKSSEFGYRLRVYDPFSNFAQSIYSICMYTSCLCMYNFPKVVNYNNSRLVTLSHSYT